MVRQSAGWMQQLDDRVLEFLDEEEPAAPGVMASKPRVDATRRQIRERFEVLADAGLAAPIGPKAKTFELTTWGKLYLEGEIDAENQPDPRQGRLIG